MYKYMGSWVFIILALFVGIAQGNRWSGTGHLNFPRQGHSCAILTNGKVMVAGSDIAAGRKNYDIFDLSTGTWSSGILPGGVDYNHTMAMLLPDGTVLQVAYGSGEIWVHDPRIGSWNNPTSFGNWRDRAPATLLKNGKMLAIVHDFSGKCRIYDYISGSVGNLSYATGHCQGVEILLPNGDVLASGGGGAGADCEIYNPASNSWSSVAPMNASRHYHVGVLLPPPWDNEVLVAGGTAGACCELYDIANDLWTITDSLNIYPREVATLTLLPSGKVLIMGGEVPVQSTCEIYDPNSATWSITDTMKYARSHNASAILPTGKILTIGSTTKVGGTSTSEIYDPSDGGWVMKPTLNEERACHTVTPLPIIPTTNCSTNVLIAGGENSSGTLKSCELYNYSLDNVSVTGELTEARTHHTAVLLASGEVLVAGGKNAGGTVKSCELYDVPTETWTTTDSLDVVRYDHAATLLSDGTVLTTGGQVDAITYVGGCEIYSGGVWNNILDCEPRARHAAVLLLDGRVLVIGGEWTSGINVCQIWDGVTWSPAADLITRRYFHTATLLQSGKVLVVGGKDMAGNPLSSCEIFDPDSNKWFPEGDLNQARYAHNTTLLYSGLVLVTGGNGGISSCETYDPATHEWTTDYTGTLGNGRAYHSSVLIPDTMPFVLAIGGKSGASYLNSIEEYDVGLGYRSIWQSTITNYPSITCISGSMDIKGTDFRGFSEADGGNYCHIASNDHPIISLVRVGGGNWQGNGGGEVMIMPHSVLWDSAQTNVVDLPAISGYYRLWSIVNGIPCKWYKECDPLGAEEGTNCQLSTGNSQVSVYPNPATHNTVVKFVVHGSQPEADEPLAQEFVDEKALTLHIYDLSGRLVRSLSIHHSPFTVHELKPGVYFYRIGPVIPSADSGQRLTLERSEGEESHTIKGKFTVVE